jgi:uncharacterized membrane protein YjjP (DUF1212 family)
MTWWRDHSLTIVMAAIGVSLIAIGFLFEDKWWDVVSGLGQGTLTGGLVFYLSRFFRETAKPEDPPEGVV